jgi:hypothetical protein
MTSWGIEALRPLTLWSVAPTVYLGQRRGREGHRAEIQRGRRYREGGDREGGDTEREEIQRGRRYREGGDREGGDTQREEREGQQR